LPPSGRGGDLPLPVKGVSVLLLMLLLVAGWPAIIVKVAYDSYKASRKELPEDKG